MNKKTLLDLTVQDYLIIKALDGKPEELIRKELIRHFKLEDISLSDLDQFLIDLNTAMRQTPRFIQRFELDGIEYGFIPNLDTITAAEWIDIDTYQKDDDNIHRLLSILYRPIVKKKTIFNFFGLLSDENYTIEKYNGTSESLRKAPLEVYLGATQFFFRLSEKLLADLFISTQKETVNYLITDKTLTTQQKINLLKSLDGII